MLPRPSSPRVLRSTALSVVQSHVTTWAIANIRKRKGKESAMSLRATETNRLNRLRLSHESNRKAKKRENKTKKNDELIKSVEMVIESVR